MTKNEVKKILAEEIERFGFEVGESIFSQMPQVKQNDNSYIAIQINEKADFESSDWKSGKNAIKIEVWANICRMGGKTTPAELTAAAKEIERGARLTAKLQEMKLGYIEEI